MASTLSPGTEIPPTIRTPESVETSLGTLAFPLGVPTGETQSRVYDHLDHVHAVNAFLNGFSGVSVWAMRKGFLDVGVGDNDVLLFSELMDAKSLFLTANADTVYFASVLDLTQGPLVVQIPPLTLNTIDDMWFRWVTDLSLPGPDRGFGGRYLIVGPGYDGPLPNGAFFVSRCRTSRAFLLGRAFVENDDPKPAVERIKQTLRIYPYSPGGYATSIGDILMGESAPPLPWTDETWAAPLTQQPAAPRFVEGSGLAMNTIPPNDESYYEFANDLVQDQPAEALDPEISGDLAAIGIVKGKPFQPDARMQKILREAAGVANAASRTIAFAARDAEGARYYDASSQWQNSMFTSGFDFMNPPAEITDQGAEQSPSDGARKLNLRTWWFYNYTGITPAMCMKLTNIGSQYLVAFADESGRSLDGGKHYKVTLPPNIPAGRFWSWTVYDNQSRSMLDTPQRYPRAGSQSYPSPAAQTDPNSTTTVHFGPEQPDSVPDGNWIQTLPDKGWFLILRLYSPLQPFFDKTWRPGEIEQIG
jgi:hypothetical protein